MISELTVPCAVGSLHGAIGFTEMEAQVLVLEAQENQMRRLPSFSPRKDFGRPNARAYCPVRSKPSASNTGASTATGAHVRAMYRGG